MRKNFKVSDKVRIIGNYEFYPELLEFKNSNNNVHTVTAVDKYGYCELDNYKKGVFYLSIERI